MLLIDKYKPKSLQDFNISETTNTMLEKFIESNKLQLLIIGDIGSGKTSLINLILKKLSNHDNKLNILNINLLKDQGLNYYKTEIKNFCENIAITSSKIIVIEDLELFNDNIQSYFYNIINFYKNTNFIISSNDILKVNNCIVDILDIIKINSIDNNFLSKILDKIIYDENILIKDEITKSYILELSNNYIANMINFLQKIKLLSYDQVAININIEMVKTIESNIIIDKFSDYIDLCYQKKSIEAYNFLKSISNNGFSVIDILENMVTFLKNNKKVKQDKAYEIIKIILKYINIFYNLHEDEIELFFLTNNIINILDK